MVDCYTSTYSPYNIPTICFLRFTLCPLQQQLVRSHVATGKKLLFFEKFERQNTLRQGRTESSSSTSYTVRINIRRFRCDTQQLPDSFSLLIDTSTTEQTTWHLQLTLHQTFPQYHRHWYTKRALRASCKRWGNSCVQTGQNRFSGLIPCTIESFPVNQNLESMTRSRTG